jgi:hypothetical protein
MMCDGEGGHQVVEYLLAQISVDEERANEPGVTEDRLLAECQVKRRIVELHREHVDPPCYTLQALAQQYRDRPEA